MHAIKTYSTTQDIISISPGEAKYYGLVKAVSIAMGIQALFRDYGICTNISAQTDAAAAKAIAQRQVR